MPKENLTNEDKIKEGKKTTRAVAKVAAKNKITKEASKAAKVAGDKALLTMASDMPVGQAKSFLTAIAKRDNIRAQQKVLALAMRGVRGELKAMKIDLTPLDHVLKLRDMDPEDARAFKATEALYTQQLGMEVSPAQQAHIDAINEKRENARKAMSDINGGDTGKEVGSGDTAGTKHAEEDGEDTDAEAPAPAPAGVPAKNEALSRPYIAASASSSAH